MEQTIEILTDNVSTLRRHTEEPIELDVYKDRAIVSIKKLPLGKTKTGKLTYRYIVHSMFVYNGKQQDNCMGYRSLKRALAFASDIFAVRNISMHKHNTKLYL